MVIAQWVEKEFKNIDLADKRLNNRAKIVATQFSKLPESLPDSAEAKTDKYLHGLYRLSRNSRVEVDHLMQPHIQKTIQRTRQHETVYLAQDTTEIDLTKPKRQVKGAGPLGGNSRRGFYLHPTLALDQRGTPLGVTAVHQWVRPEIDTSKSRKERKKDSRNLPIEQKESFRWVDMIRRAKELAVEAPATRYINLSMANQISMACSLRSTGDLKTITSSFVAIKDER